MQKREREGASAPEVQDESKRRGEGEIALTSTTPGPWPGLTPPRPGTRSAGSARASFLQSRAQPEARRLLPGGWAAGLLVSTLTGEQGDAAQYTLLLALRLQATPHDRRAIN